ncbi:MAG: Flp pilus assembly protein CpaB [Candidatus Zixiibacteriota bacterium]
MKKSTLFLTAGLALVFAAIASLMIFSYLKSRPAQGTQDMMPVVVAVEDLTFGNVLKPEQMTTVLYPRASMPKGYYSEKDSLIGQVTKVFLMENEPITASKLSSAGGGLSLRIADNMRAASIQVDKVSGVSGFVLPGDRVDVIASIDRYGADNDAIATTVLQNVEVLAAGEKTEQQDDKVIQSQAVTLLVDAAGAQALALSSRQARMSLALRNPNDTDTVSIAGITRREIIEGKKPKEAPPKVVYKKSPEKKPAPAKEQPKPVDNTVTVFKGGEQNTQTPPITEDKAAKDSTGH